MTQKREQYQTDIAIIGMACHFPKATTLDAYWNNIINQVNGTTIFLTKI